MLSECRVYVHTGEGIRTHLMSSRLGVTCSVQMASYLDASLSLKRLYYNITHYYYVALIIFSVVLYVLFCFFYPIFPYFPVVATPVSNTPTVSLPSPIYTGKIIFTVLAMAGGLQ